MIRVRVHYDDTGKLRYGYFDGERKSLFFSGALYTAEDMRKANGVIRSPNRALCESLRNAGYPVERVPPPPEKWNKKKLRRVSTLLTLAEEQSLLSYCERLGVSMYAALRDIILDAIGRGDAL